MSAGHTSGRLLFAALVWASLAGALEPDRALTQHVHETWREEDGLPQNSIFSLAQTPDGFLWLGTEEGLVRFDGQRFRVFDKVSAAGLKNNVIRHLAVDRRGVLWAGTDTSGACRFQLAPGPRFECLARDEGVGTVYALAAAPDGSMWIGSERGLVQWSASSTESWGQRHAPLAEPVTALLVEADRAWIATGSRLWRLSGKELQEVSGVQAPRAMLRSSDGRLWLGTPTGPLVETVAGFAPPDGAPTAEVWSLLEDRSGAVWLGTRDGLWRHQRGQFEHLALGGRPGNRVVALLEDQEESLWYGTVLDGVGRLRAAPFVPFGAVEGLAGEYTTALAEGGGRLWVGTGGAGLSSIQDGRVQAWPGRLPSAEVTSLGWVPSSGLWVGTAAGVVQLAVEPGALLPTKAEPVPALESLVRPTALYAESDGTVWVGSYAQGLLRWKAGAVRAFTRADGLSSDAVHAVLRRRDGELWVGGTGGVARQVGERFEALPAPELASTTVYVLAEEGDALWMATMDAGLFRWKDGKLGRVSARQGLHDDTGFALLSDGTHFWVSCNKGVFRVALAELDEVADGRREKVSCAVFGRLDGMRSRECTGGVQKAGLRDARGRLWFTTLRGVTSVDPKQLYPNPLPARAFIEDLRHGGKSTGPVHTLQVPAGTSSFEVHYTSSSLRVPGRVRFRYRLEGLHDWVEAGNRRSAFFGAVPPGDFRFEVAAANDDGAWGAVETVAIRVEPRFWQTRAFPVLLGLFLLGGVGLSAWWRIRLLEAREKELARQVELRTQELAQRHQALEERTAELDRTLASLRATQSELVRAEKMASVATLVRGIAHELNNPVGFIVGNLEPLRRYCDFLAQVASRLADGKPRDEAELRALTRLSNSKDLAFVVEDLRRLTADMAEGGRRARLIVGDLQGLVGGEKRALEQVDVAKAMQQSVALLRAGVPSGVEIQVEAAPKLPRLTFRAGHLEQLLVNLIDNAVRAVGPKGRVRVHAVAETEGVRLRIEDDGVGMSEEVLQRATEPFFTTRGPGEGSGLGLAISASIVREHEGRLELKSRPGEGTVVSVWLPCGGGTARS